MTLPSELEVEWNEIVLTFYCPRFLIWLMNRKCRDKQFKRLNQSSTVVQKRVWLRFDIQESMTTSSDHRFPSSCPSWPVIGSTVSSADWIMCRSEGVKIRALSLLSSTSCWVIISSPASFMCAVTELPISSGRSSSTVSWSFMCWASRSAL